MRKGEYKTGQGSTPPVTSIEWKLSNVHNVVKAQGSEGVEHG